MYEAKNGNLEDVCLALSQVNKGGHPLASLPNLYRKECKRMGHFILNFFKCFHGGKIYVT